MFTILKKIPQIIKWKVNLRVIYLNLKINIDFEILFEVLGFGDFH
jgi:hypothetical protein